MAMQKRLDIFGILVCAFITSIGGGTLRDLMIGDLPVKWLRNEMIILIIFLGAVLAIVRKNRLAPLAKALFLFDSIGLGLFTIIGIQKGIDAGFSIGVSISLGTITACFGGVIRDVVLNQVPLIFRKEIYASACIAGGILYAGLNHLYVHVYVVQSICIIFIVGVRIIAVKYKLSLPSFY